jgi:hypothetical protein
MTRERAGTLLATASGMSGHKQKKKDHQRQDKPTSRRQHDFEQAVVGSVTRQRAQDVSNLTDGDIAGPDWKHKSRTDRG